MNDWRERLERLRIGDRVLTQTTTDQLLVVACDALTELIATLRPLAMRDDFATAATSQDVCTCAYKPYPHPRLPAHPHKPSGKGLEVAERPVYGDGEQSPPNGFA